MQRDDLFTNIHKAIRAGLFDLTVTAGATDWNNPTAVAGFGDTWCRLHALLEAHTHQSWLRPCRKPQRRTHVRSDC